MIKIKEKMVGDVAICTIEGKLSGIEGKGQIQERIRELMGKDITKIILDLSKVSWIDSTGLGELIASLSSIKKKDGNMVLTNLQAPVQSLLKMTNLTQIFDAFEGVEDALREFAK
ncbi:MAG: STAS domain-containing protein [bacterium]